jgi:hypothetical protein
VTYVLFSFCGAVSDSGKSGNVVVYVVLCLVRVPRLFAISGCSSSVVLFCSDDDPARSKHVANVHNKRILISIIALFISNLLC